MFLEIYNSGNQLFSAMRVSLWFPWITVEKYGEKRWIIQSWMHTKDGEVSSFSYGIRTYEICWENFEVRWLPTDIKGQPTSYNWRTASRGNAVFQQDFAPYHKSKSIKKCLTKRNTEILPWPANSPDLNPIENVLNDIKRLLGMKKCYL